MKPFRFVVNLLGNMVHKLETREQCNVDQVPREFRKKLQSTEGYKRFCAHCFGRKKK